MLAVIQIFKADTSHTNLISEMGGKTILESHENSAPLDDLNAYIANAFNFETTQKELSEPGNVFHILYYNDKPAGYSKIIHNSPQPKVASQNISKLQRIYFLKEYYGLGLGQKLFDFNVELSKQADQVGMWLTVWPGNPRAIAFYEKNGFEKIDDTVFKVSETHINPNFVLYKKYLNVSDKSKTEHT